MTTWLTVREAADYIRVSETVIRKAVKHGYLESYTFESGKHVRLRAEDIDAWMMNRAWEPQPKPKYLD